MSLQNIITIHQEIKNLKAKLQRFQGLTRSFVVLSTKKRLSKLQQELSFLYSRVNDPLELENKINNYFLELTKKDLQF